MGGVPLAEVRRGFEEGKSLAISRLQTLIEMFEERLGISARKKS
jgi:hypothetical protein